MVLPMATLGQLLQLAGLCVTGAACLLGFQASTTMETFVALGIGGFLAFLVGGQMRGKAS